METKKLNKEMIDKIGFISYIIPKFASEYKMGVQQAYQYLKKYGGLAFLMEHWWALHTYSGFLAVRDLYDICYKNGGER
jgi:hypothetical protein